MFLVEKIHNWRSASHLSNKIPQTIRFATMLERVQWNVKKNENRAERERERENEKERRNWTSSEIIRSAIRLDNSIIPRS